MYGYIFSTTLFISLYIDLEGGNEADRALSNDRILTNCTLSSMGMKQDFCVLK